METEGRDPRAREVGKSQRRERERSQTFKKRKKEVNLITLTRHSTEPQYRDGRSSDESRLRDQAPK